ncbi:hypothetical protein J3R83DRAFT_3851 [Lanmaoa asiatica]|nr:hypothetical protein J3R83DRAFT_3851 [Lanmaoa asiatica]
MPPDPSIAHNPPHSSPMVGHAYLEAKKKRIQSNQQEEAVAEAVRICQEEEKKPDSEQKRWSDFYHQVVANAKHTQEEERAREDRCRKRDEKAEEMAEWR